MHYMVIFYESWSLAMIRQRPFLHAGHFRPPVRHKVDTWYNNFAIQTEYSNPSASEEFWFDFKKEWIFLLCPFSFIWLLCVSIMLTSSIFAVTEIKIIMFKLVSIQCKYFQYHAQHYEKSSSTTSLTTNAETITQPPESIAWTVQVDTGIAMLIDFADGGLFGWP